MNYKYILIVLFTILLILANIVKIFGYMPLLVLLILVATGFIIYATYISNRSNRIYKEIYKIIKRHITVLARKREILFETDEYGYTRFDSSKWINELQYFVNNVIMIELYMYDSNVLSREILNIDFDSIINEILSKNHEENVIKHKYNNNMNGVDYEHYCRKVIQNQGWPCQMTPASGDQGADVIVNLNNNKIVIQCKKYSSPVGNKAVQEIFSAKGYYSANFALVVSNSSYTSSAKKLAHKLKVFLIHHEDLCNLDSILSIKSNLINNEQIKSEDTNNKPSTIFETFKFEYKEKNYFAAKKCLINLINKQLELLHFSGHRVKHFLSYSIR